VRAPNITYGFLTPTDTSGPMLQVLSRQEQLSSSAVLFTFTVDDIPKDRILVLSNASLAAEPNAALVLEEMKIQGVTQTGLIFDIATDITVEAAGVRKSLDWAGEVWIQGGGLGTSTLRATALFNSNASPNIVSIGWHGVVIPHGNAASF